MNNSTNKIGALIIVVIILPVLVFSVFEFGNLQRNEKTIQEIYENQLDAILFSINQYSDDVISGLAGKIENNLNTDAASMESEMIRIIDEIPSVIYIIQYDTIFRYLSSAANSKIDSSTIFEVRNSLIQGDSIVTRLYSYLKAGYRKIEPLTVKRNLQWLIFISDIKGKSVINALGIDPEKFINQTLDPKIQETAKNKFNISVYQKGEKAPFYTSNKKTNSGKVSVKKSFWIFNDFLMGIEMREQTISDLSQSRAKKNFILIVVMDFILLAGAWLIYRNIKKQVELSQLKSDFVSNVSHEIRTPLALISMYIETLEMGRINNPEKIKEYYNIILTETNRLSGIVNRILNFSQIENNKRKYVFEQTNINEVVAKTENSFKHTLDKKEFRYIFEPGKDLPFIQADKESIADALINLIDNSVKYSNGNKEIIVRTGAEDQFVYIEVEDHGIGISHKDQKYIFDKFYRVSEKDLANKVKGSGLGLAIVKHIVDSHKGRISVKSAPGSGSVFRLLFPLK